MTFLDRYVMCVMKATWEVCINTIKVLVEVVLPRCLSGREIINVNEDSSTLPRMKRYGVWKLAEIRICEATRLSPKACESF